MNTACQNDTDETCVDVKLTEITALYRVSTE